MIKNKLMQRRRPSSLRSKRRLKLEGLETRALLAANILATTEVAGQQVIQEYDPAGSLVSQTAVPVVGAAERAHDLILDGDGKLHVYNGSSTPDLSTLDRDSGTWSHQTMPGWSTFSSAYYGGIGVFENYVFATDMFGSGAAAPKGVVRFDMDTGASTRFDNWYSYSDLTVGQDGLLYAQSSRTIRVYDPVSLSLQRTVTLPFSINGQSQVYRGIAVDASGDIYAASWREQIHRFDSTGNVQASVTVPEPEPFFGSFTDIDLSDDGRLVLGTYWGYIVQMNDDFTDISYIDTGMKSVFVAFDSAGTPPVVPEASVSDVFVDEDDTFASLDITLNQPTTVPVTVDYTTTEAIAKPVEDYIHTSGTVTFLPGEISKSVSVPIVDDVIDEFGEAFFLDLTSASGATIDDNRGFITISDDDTATLSIADTSIVEGDAGDVAAEFVVSLSTPSSFLVRVDFETVDQSATAGTDYTATSGRLEWAPGEISKTITVPVHGDTDVEPDELFDVLLSDPFFSSITDDTGTATIVNDDAPPANPSISISGTYRSEFYADDFLFDVTLSEPTTVPVTVSYSNTHTLDTATPGVDYVPQTGTLTFQPGEVSKSISVTVIDDNVDEPTEIFNVDLLSATGGDIATSQALGWIANDDYASFSFSDTSVVENEFGYSMAVFDVTFTNPVYKDVTFDFGIDAITATAGVDYDPAVGSVTVAAGETEQTVSVLVYDDNVHESDETFTLHGSSADHFLYQSGSATGTIIDNDLPSITIDDLQIVEGDSGSQQLMVSAFLSNPTEMVTSFDYQTVDGTATGGVDYASQSGTLTFPGAQTYVVFFIDVYGDLDSEISETFTVELSQPVNATLGDSQAVVTIIDND